MKLKKIVKTALDQLEKGNYTLEDVYTLSYRESIHDNIFFEYSSNGIIKEVTYKEALHSIDVETNNLCRILKDYPQDSVVGIKLENSPEWITTFWAILRAGFIPYLVNTKIVDQFNEAALKNAKAVAVISKTPFMDFKFINVDDLLEESEPTKNTRKFADKLMLSTSGTTKNPKICVYDGRAITNHLLNARHIVKTNPGIISTYNGRLKHLAFLPFYHIFGLCAVLTWFNAFGQTFVFLNDLSPKTLKNTILRHEVTHIFAVPVLFDSAVKSILREVNKRDEKTIAKFNKGIALSNKLQSRFPRLGMSFAKKAFKEIREQAFGDSIRFLITGGGFISKETLTVLNGLGYPLFNGYGMSELGIASVELSKKANIRNEALIGKPLPSIEYKLETHENGSDELLVRGSSLCIEIIDGDNVIKREKDEWFHTKDAAVKEKHGYRLVGRVDDIVVDDSGELISPEVVESSFTISEAKCVAFVKNDGNNCLILEFAEHTPNVKKRNAFMKAVKQNASLKSVYQIAEFYEIVGQRIPLALECKIKHRDLNNMFKANPEAFVKYDIKTLEETSVEEVLTKDIEETLVSVIEVFASVFEMDIKDINKDTHFLYDLSGTSIQYFSLLTELSNKMEVEIGYDSEAPLATPLDFAKYIVENK